MSGLSVTDPGATRAWVLHPEIAGDPARRSAADALAEARSLAHAMPGMTLAGAEIVRVVKPRPSTLFGPGKVEDLAARFADDEIELVLVDGQLTPVQQRNLERAWKLKILDRTALILEIFADRARTREGVLQVEMAALSYQRTRLVRAWTHLERQRGGLGFVGGPGETQIEADRRAIDEAIMRLRRQLDRVIKTRDLHRSARTRAPYPVVALVGYTNAGKSTLFNRLTGAAVMARDMLFATLDPTMRAIDLPSGPKVILSDTVGFISALPTELVAAFRATLEEVVTADLILHVRDIAHPETEAQAADVHDILAGLGIDRDAPLIEVWNKVDLLEGDARARVDAKGARKPEVHLISAETGEGIADLLAAVTGAISEPMSEQDLHLDYSQGRRRAWLFDRGVVVREREDDEGFAIRVRWTDRQRQRFQAL